jgi:chemotaxis protein CheY-P-specific phosphatase CheC
MSPKIAASLSGMVERMAGTLGQIVNSPVKQREVISESMPLSRVPDALKTGEGEVFIVLQTISGGMRGAAMLIFDGENSQVFSESNSHRAVSELLLDKTAKLEILNMLVGNLLTDLRSSLKITAAQSVPSFVSGRIEEVMDAVLLEFMDAENMHLILSELSIERSGRPLHFALLFTK